MDNNPEYDNLQIQAIDDEEKYFDSESPVEENDKEKIPTEENDTDDEEDELDTYMNMLKRNEITDSVAEKLKHL